MSTNAASFFSQVFDTHISVQSIIKKKANKIVGDFSIIEPKIKDGVLLSFVKPVSAKGLEDFYFTAIDISAKETMFLKSSNIGEHLQYTETGFEIVQDSLLIYRPANGGLIILKGGILQKTEKSNFEPLFCTVFYYFNGNLFKSGSVYGSYVQNIFDSTIRFYTSTSARPFDYRFSTVALPFNKEVNIVSAITKPDTVTCFGLDQRLKLKWSIELPISFSNTPYFNIQTVSNSFLIFLNDSIYCFDATSGKKNWSTTLNGLIQQVVIDRTSTLIYCKLLPSKKTANSMVGLFSLSGKDGSIKWTHQFSTGTELYNYPFLVNRKAIFFFDTESITEVNVHTGNIISRHKYSQKKQDYLCTVVMDATNGDYYYLNDKILFFNK